jgi:transcriptional regulator with XRE-family HTH domain
MEFNEKLQELRKSKGLTQEALAEALYVSRAAISKWESGKGYPNIDSLKALAKFFSVTIDELLSSDEILVIAVEEKKKTESYFRDNVTGLLDLCMTLLIFLPFFAARVNGSVQESSLLALEEIQPYLKIIYFVVVIAMAIVGILTLVLRNGKVSFWDKVKTVTSLALNLVAVLIFVVSLQPYAAVFAFALLAVKVFILIKR